MGDTNETLINIGLWASYILIAVAVLGILVFSVTNIFKKPRGAKGVLIGIGGLGVILGLSWAFSTGEDVNTMFAGLDVSEATSRRIGMGLTSFYILAALAILSIIYVEVTRLFK